MKYALFIGCQIPARVSQYEMAVRMVLRDLDVDLVDERQFNCCGYLCTAVHIARSSLTWCRR